MKVIASAAMTITLALALAMPELSHAARAEANFKVKMDVQAVLELEGEAGKGLPSFALSSSGKLPGPVSHNVRIVTNDLLSSVQVSLVGDARIVMVGNPNAVMPLNVKFDGDLLSASKPVLVAPARFLDGATPRPVSLEIGPQNVAELAAGEYSGKVTLKLTHPASTQ